ncbi:MAG: hypothetical protein COW03_01575 [Cytophagales bacterium CG12_big_fil_rev_8_21_14_0_65_40_12]|nr:MAG: hypothetical protein COW03_01575 [Cytophagales bacterium CG12_big_fil_rev_8_21_14_0_65_40_12]PIW03972.1 MAG: hypothetical protein COW40_12475 [Cytophagales bacterium CG17_big_fil_post_rev_8_21_14_2_50_40_13]
MNVKLRQRHRYIWMVMGIALPLLCLEAIEHIPANPLARIPINICPVGIANCEVVSSHDIDYHAFEWSYDIIDETTTLKLDLVRPLKSAFSLVYLSKGESPDKNSILLGGLNEMKHYEFSFPWGTASKMDHILVWDKLNNKQLFFNSINDLKP